MQGLDPVRSKYGPKPNFAKNISRIIFEGKKKHFNEKKKKHVIIWLKISICMSKIVIHNKTLDQEDKDIN